jgi:hypothetical protein
LEPIIKNISEERREAYKINILEGLKDYEFSRRKRDEAPHPETMVLKEGKKVLWEKLDYEKPEDVVRALTTILLPYYVADTQNRVKTYLERNL